MNDFELFEAMNEAEERFEALKAELRARGLQNKPFYEYSHSRPTPLAPDGAKWCENCVLPPDDDGYCIRCGEPTRPAGKA